MRSNPFKVLAVVIMTLAGLSSAPALVTNIVDWNTPWRYSNGGELPAVNWNATNYNDSAWPSGVGVLGFPANENLVIGGVAVNTLLTQTSSNGTYIWTHYFRTRFVLPTTNGVTLMASNLLDDGAVIYLNGREIARPGMAAGVVSYTTEATRGGEIADATHGVDFYSIPLTNAVVGTNVLAVEVHQNGNNSSDMIMGMRLVADIPQPPVITVHPQDRTVDVGQVAMFSVTAFGDIPLTYRWYTNGILVPNLNSATYNTPATTLAMDGMVVYVTVSNRLARVQSSNAVLTVVEDLSGPVMLSAVTTATNSFEIRFNENITQVSSQNPSNYIVYILGTTNTLVVTQAQWGINLSRLRISGTFDPNTNYVVCISGIVDQRGNVTSRDCIGITGPPITNSVFTLGSSGWRFADFITNDRMDHTNWTSLSFREDPNDWADGFGIFWFDQVNFNPQCSSLGTGIINFPETQYFRKRFDLASTFGTGVTLRVNYLVDDGAVFYINGREVNRVNMPPGPVIYSTRPSGPMDANVCQAFSVLIDGTILRTGSNVFAVELHQVANEGANNDMVFDADLSFVYRETATIPALTAVRTYTTNIQGRITATNAVLTWVGTGWALQHAILPTGTWANITSGITTIGGTNRYTTVVPQQGPRRFYRLKNP